MIKLHESPLVSFLWEPKRQYRVKRTFTKKYPVWQNAKELIRDIAYHCHIEVVPIAEYRRFIFFTEYKYFVKGRKENLNVFAEQSGVALRKIK